VGITREWESRGDLRYPNLVGSGIFQSGIFPGLTILLATLTPMIFRLLDTFRGAEK
jgi:hypothetical protein